jgi:hypothetical protein
MVHLYVVPASRTLERLKDTLFPYQSIKMGHQKQHSENGSFVQLSQISLKNAMDLKQQVLL